MTTTTRQVIAAGAAAAEPVELRASAGLFTTAGRALLRDRLTIVAIVVFLSLCLIAVFADVIGMSVFGTRRIVLPAPRAFSSGP